jgi:hypothetical protein
LACRKEKHVAAEASPRAFFHQSLEILAPGKPAIMPETQACARVARGQAA